MEQTLKSYNFNFDITEPEMLQKLSVLLASTVTLTACVKLDAEPTDEIAGTKLAANA